jgi:dienelactone hydrolase
MFAAMAVAACLIAAPAAAPTVPATAAGTADPLPGVPGDLKTVDVDFQGSGGLAMHGTVLSAAGGAPRRPGMVLVGGSGSGTPRTKLLPEAIAFARQGLAVLIYDKRSEGYSRFQRDFSQLAGDALGAVAALRETPGVDRRHVGIWGFSEGGWIAPLAASRSTDISFVVVVGANAMEPLRQQTWSVAAGLRLAGVTGPLVERTEPVMYRIIADGGMFPEPYYDPGPTLAAVRQPVLAIWGAHDLLTPPEENPPLMARALERGGNRHYTFRFVPDADHAAHRTPDGGVTRLPELAPGYADAVGSWVKQVTTGVAPVARVTGTTPVQAIASVPVSPPAWWESAPVQLGVLILFLVAFTGYPLVALVRRLRRRSQAPVSRAGRLLCAGGLVTVLGSFCYLFAVLLGGTKEASPGPLVAGRPVFWLALQVLAVACVIATVRTGLAWWRARGAVAVGERVRLVLLLAAGVVFLSWAVYWGLLLP